MIRGVFVTGTDTGVGKTVTAAALMHRYRRIGAVRYWKPIQTGIEADDDTATVRDLSECAEEEIFDNGIRLPRPLSPHLAARLAGQEIKLDRVIALLASQPTTARWIVEGAGGVRVPINDSDFMTDLIERLAIPALVVARSGLGTINHTLLTIEALRRRSLVVAGVVMVGEPNHENRQAIERFGNVPVIGEMPPFPDLSPEVLGRWAAASLDRGGHLEELLK
jgi:dethiobiotin synthase